MAVEVILPKVDMDMATGRISRWHVKEGEPVRKGDVLFEIETDKAAMEVDSPASGTLRQVTGEEGVDIPVGQPVAFIYAEGEAEAPQPAAAAPKAEASGETSEKPVAPKTAESGAVAPWPNGAAPEPVPAGPSEKPRATPLARRLARETGIDLSALRGSGPRGRIQRRDIEEHRAEGPKQPETGLPAGKSVSANGSAAPKVAEVPAPSSAKAPAAPAAVPSLADADTPLGAVWLREGAGTPLVLLHGFGADHASWRPLLTAFDRTMPILGVDLPGHGRSVDAAAGGFADLVAAVEATLSAFGLSSAHLVGHSLGGAVATAVAAGEAIEARSLFLLAPAGLGPEINTAFIEGFAAATDAQAVRAWMGELVADPAVLSDSLVGATARARANGRLPAAQVALGRSLFTQGTQLFSTRALFDRLAMPVKVVVGTEDRIVPSRQATGLPGHVALHVFPQVGHMLQIERKAEVARLLAEIVRP